jgi:diacylglycerol kinase (ATP)
MRKVALIYNPHSGNHTVRRLAQLRVATQKLREAGYDAEILATRAAGTAATQALEAVAAGTDTILACGGDGTVNEIMQALVGTDAALGVLPQGTANALAADLGIPANPKRALKILLNALPTRIPVGHITYKAMDGGTASRYFTVAAGVGADGKFFSTLDSRLKRRYGYLLYVIEAFRLWATHNFPLFETKIYPEKEAAPGQPKPDPQPHHFSQLLTVRITDFGGVVHRLVPGAALLNPGLSVIATRTRSRLRYLRFIFAVFFGSHTYKHTFELFNANSVECAAINGSTHKIYVEADGELLGTLPTKMEVCPNALTLLVPQKKK